MTGQVQQFYLLPGTLKDCHQVGWTQGGIPDVALKVNYQNSHIYLGLSYQVSK